MSGKTVYDTVSSVEIADGVKMPCAHMVFPVGSAPELPWCVYYLDEMDGYAADNSLHARRNNWIVEHYWKVYDPDIEEALENALAASFGVFYKTETRIEDENCAQTAYYFAEIEKESEAADESE